MEIDIDKVVELVRTEVAQYEVPMVDAIAQKKRDPFKILLCTLLSSRTKDSVTKEACERLWNLGKTPEEILKLSTDEIEKSIYPVGFYRNKAVNVQKMCKQLVEEHGSVVPATVDELVKLQGVGRKTANLVLSLGFQKDAICVDTHVHRFFNRIGYVSTSKPVETEQALMKKLPRKYWQEINGFLVSFGQNLCKPISPWCSKCPVSGYCEKNGVDKSR